MMWIDTTLRGLVDSVHAMVGSPRLLLALQSEGRNSVEADWQVISQFADFREGFGAIANIAAVAGWGRWELVSYDPENRECRFRVTDSWEGRYQRSMGVCRGSGLVAGKLAGYCTRLFGINCWPEQTAFIAKGDAYDEFYVRSSTRLIETEIEGLLATDEATRADMAVALRKLELEIAERKRAEAALREREEQFRSLVETTSDWIWETGADGCYTYASPKVHDLLGYPPAEVTGKRPFEFMPPDEARRLEAEVARIAAAKSPFFNPVVSKNSICF
jgi:PAS domain-containing protein